MHRNLTIALIIPTLNEEAAIAKTLESVPSEIDEVIVVDGESTDRTVEIAKEYGATVITEKRPGYGRAYLTGFEHATADIISTTDGDTTYPLESIPKMVDLIVDKGIDFVSGSRFPLTRWESMHQSNFIGNMVVGAVTNAIFKSKIVDINTGMWVFRAKPFLDKAQFISEAWNLSLEIKIEAIVNSKIKFYEYPIDYRARIGDSKVTQKWRTGAKSLIFLVVKKLGVNKRRKRGEL